MPKDRDINPVALQRKKDKAKDLKRNRELRKQQREATLHTLTPDAIAQQLGKIRRLERSGQVDEHVMHKKRRLEAEMEEARKREQERVEEERRRAAEPEPTIVIKGLEKIVGKAASKRSEEKEEETDVETVKDKSAALNSAAAPVDPAVELGIEVPPGQRVWLDEPPGLKKPPHSPPPPTTSTPYSSSAPPLIAPSSLSALRQPPHAQPSLATPPTADQPIIRILLPPTPQPAAWQPSAHPPLRPPQSPPRPPPPQSHGGFRGARPPPRSSSSAEPPEVDPLDPNPDTAHDAWNKARGRGRGAASVQPSSHPSAVAAPPPSVSSLPAPRVIPRPAFVPTNLLVKNRPVNTDASAAVGRPNLSRPVNTITASVTVNAAPSISRAPIHPPSAAGGAPKQRTQAELEYEALMRSLEAEGALS